MEHDEHLHPDVRRGGLAWLGAASLNFSPIPSGASSTSLCATCNYGMVYRREPQSRIQNGSHRVWCKFIHEYVPPDVRECSKYVDGSIMSWEEIAARAVIIDPRPTPGQHL